MQSTPCTPGLAQPCIENINETFCNIRKNTEEKFLNIFHSASELLDQVNEGIQLPRIAGVQRLNKNMNDPEQFYRVAVVDPLLDNFICQVNSRFLEQKSIMVSFYASIPTVCCDKSLDNQDFKIL